MFSICLDIEAADSGEILELSIFRRETGKEIFHQYFKPRRARTWPKSQRVHHITPEMVKDKPSFDSMKKEIKKIISSADVLIGFAVDNDIRYLERAGIQIPLSCAIVEVKQWYWVCKGKAEGYTPFNIPRLVDCANSLGINFPETEAHSAETDTLNTLRVFEELHTMFNHQYCGGDDPEFDFGKLVQFDDIFSDHMAVIDREAAHGYISLQQTERGYVVRNNRERPEQGVVIEVPSRFRAEHEIRQMFLRRNEKGRPGTYLLRESDIEAFKCYSVDYDAEKESFFRQIYHKRKPSPGGLDFHF